MRSALPAGYQNAAQAAQAAQQYAFYQAQQPPPGGATAPGMPNMMAGMGNFGNLQAQDLQQFQQQMQQQQQQQQQMVQQPPATVATTPKRGFYAVRRGRDITGCVFTKWEDAQPHIEHFYDAEYRILDNLQDALAYIDTEGTLTAAKPPPPAEPPAPPAPPGYVLNKKEPMPCDLYPDIAQKHKDELANGGKGKMVLKLGKFHLPLNEIMEDGFHKSRPKGWRATDLQLSCKRGKAERDLFQSRYLRDLAELRGYMTAKPFVQQRTLYTSETPDGPAKQIKDPASGISHPLALSYLNWAWGVNAVYHLQLEPFVYDTSNTTDAGILRQVKPPPRKKPRKRRSTKPEEEEEGGGEPSLDHIHDGGEKLQLPEAQAGGGEGVTNANKTTNSNHNNTAATTNTTEKDDRKDEGDGTTTAAVMI